MLQNSMLVPMGMLYIMSFYLVFGFDEWFLVWLGLELNMISFLMLGYKSDDVVVAEAMGSYFFVQSLGSGMLLGMLYIGWNDVVWVLLLVMSMGAGPFYFWYIKVMKSFKWVTNLILMVFQKVILLLLMSEVVSMVVLWLGLMSMLVGVAGVFNQASLSAILGFSSIFHNGWMMCLFLDSSKVWWVYLFVYGLMMWGVVDVIVKMNMVSLNGGLKSFLKKKMLLLVLNLGGVPPMVGFILKWLSFYVLWEFDLGLMGIMLALSVAMLYVYIRVLYEVSLGGLNMMCWSVGVSYFSWGEVLSFGGLLMLGLMI